MKKKPVRKRPVAKKKKSTTARSSASNSFYVVGIGASAGGLDALERFFRKMPENSGMAFIVVSHLDPNHVSIMPELVQKSTRMVLFQAEDGMVVEPNHVYVAPANRELSILHGTIQLMEPVEAHGFRLPIDLFFKSLSADVGDKAVCIVLSGMASDGTIGLKAVKNELGMVMAQDPASAQFDGMPRSAIKTGLVDFVLAPEEMPERLMKYAAMGGKISLSEKVFAGDKLPDALQKIFILLRTQTGQDFSMYKTSTMYRRIERRMTVCQMDTLAHYVRLVQENPTEIENLFQELLIGVTSFFRDPESFEKLKKLFTEMIKSKPENGLIRIWVPACSTGEEAYSLAMILRECLHETKKHLNVQIFATDIDSHAIEKGRLAAYAGIASDVNKKRLNRFFTSEGNLFHVRKEIREMLIFAPQSVIKDPPFTKLDLVSCRNLLIYLNADLQKRLIPLFHYSLLQSGILFLGSSENISGFIDLFSMVDKKWKIYRRRDSVYSAQPFMEFPIVRSIAAANEPAKKPGQMRSIAQISEKVILQSYSPNCVIITTNGDILYVHGRTGQYLELTNGEAKMNIFDMAHAGLHQELPGLIRKVVSTKKSVTAHGIRVKSNGITRVVNVTVRPINEPAEMHSSLLIIFDEPIRQSEATASKSIPHGKKSVRVIRELERELRNTREDLRSTIEELETTNEELKSTNEEMQSTNEEMQSTNEELETSKEELQSLNEELVTVNTELQNKNDELSGTNNDMKNLMDSIDIPTIFLDNRLLIKRFTFHATKVVNLIAADIGRPINHIATKFRYEKLVDDAEEVLRTLVFKELELQTKDGLWYQMRIIPYRTINNVIDGVVIRFSDINNLKSALEQNSKLNQDLELARQYADNIIDTVREALLILDNNLKVVSANRSFYKMFSTASDRTVGRFIYELDDNHWEIPELRELLEQIIPERNVFEDFEVEYNFAKGGRTKLLLNARQIVHGETETKLILLAIERNSIT